MRDIVIKKTIVLSAIAIMCLVVGLAYGVAAQDRILMIMSGIICTVNVYKIYELFQIFKKENKSTFNALEQNPKYKIF